jgi:REP element-mobilizing transposase RayT
MGFKEEILCHLNRNVQSSKDFECHAYAPRLKSAPSLVPNLEALSDGEKHDGLPDGFESLLNSDRFKYQVTLAVQRLEQNPDAVFVNLKYHLAWNVTARRPVFVDSGNTFDSLNKAFLTGSEFVGGFAGLLWLATDHIHIYVKSDGDKSIEAVVQEMKRLSAKALHKATEDQSSQFNTDRQIWDKAYFSETVG